jgi:hypothetical protein
MWFANQDVAADKCVGSAEKEADEQINLEYGIPAGVIKKIEEQAKLLN